MNSQPIFEHLASVIGILKKILWACAKFVAGALVLTILGALTGELIHFLSAEKTMVKKLLWANIPFVLLVFYTLGVSLYLVWCALQRLLNRQSGKQPL